MSAALELLELASAFQKRTQPDAEPISWAQPLLRPAANAKQARDFSKIQTRGGSSLAAQSDSPDVDREKRRKVDTASSGAARAESCMLEAVSVRALGLEEAARMVPGLPEQQLSAELGHQLTSSAALLVEGAYVLHPTRYLRYARAQHIKL